MSGKRKHGKDQDRYEDSCTVGEFSPSARRQRWKGGNDREDELYAMMVDLESTFTPSDKQDELMRQLCRNLGLSHTEVTKDLTSHELYSAKLSDLIEQDRQRRSRADLEVTPNQQSYLFRLGVKADEMRGLNRASASRLISSKLQMKELVAPTEAQIQLLQDLKYDGPTPASKSKAHAIIQEIKDNKRIKYLQEKAMKRGMDAATIKGLMELVRKYNL